jgi:hypothetical protein
MAVQFGLGLFGEVGEVAYVSLGIGFAEEGEDVGEVGDHSWIL